MRSEEAYNEYILAFVLQSIDSLPLKTVSPALLVQLDYLSTCTNYLDHSSGLRQEPPEALQCFIAFFSSYVDNLL